MKIELTEARLVKKRDPHSRGRFRYYYRRFILVNGNPIGMDGFMETTSSTTLGAANLKKSKGIWQGMAVGPDGYCVPLKVAAAVVGYLQERGIL